jgi:hypothetical protein
MNFINIVPIFREGFANHLYKSNFFKSRMDFLATSKNIMPIASKVRWYF